MRRCLILMPQISVKSDLASVKTTVLLPHNPSCLAPCLGMPVFQSRMPESSWRPSNHIFQVKSLDLVLLDIYGSENTVKINTVKKIQRWNVFPKRDAKSRLENRSLQASRLHKTWLGLASIQLVGFGCFSHGRHWPLDQLSIGRFHGNT